ncbi:MAG: hypothetical protein K2X08_04795 [Chlamydiales bacterium]|nr:hypothetical protein [Chlamydiales bacterium]
MKQESLIYSVLVLAGLAVGAAMICCAQKSPTIGVVDMRLLISQCAQAIVQPGVTLRSHQIKDLSLRLRNDLNDLANENGVILLTKEVVAAGQLPDYTDAAMSLIEKGNRP